MEMAVWWKQSRMEHDQMESVGSQEVTECDGAEDDQIVMSAGGYCDLSAHVPGSDIGPTVEETEMKKVRKECDVSFHQPIRLWVIWAVCNR